MDVQCFLDETVKKTYVETSKHHETCRRHAFEYSFRVHGLVLAIKSVHGQASAAGGVYRGGMAAAVATPGSRRRAGHFGDAISACTLLSDEDGGRRPSAEERGGSLGNCLRGFGKSSASRQLATCPSLHAPLSSCFWASCSSLVVRPRAWLRRSAMSWCAVSSDLWRYWSQRGEQSAPT